MPKKIIIIGGGPGGYVAAIRAAQLNAEVHLIENAELGGTCLNVGCIPTKVLIHTSELYQSILHSGLIGLQPKKIEIDWKTLIKRKEEVVGQLVGGVKSLLRSNHVVFHKGKGVLSDTRTVKIDGQEDLHGDAIILAVGSVPVDLNFPGADLPGVINSTEALSLPNLPSSMVIVGGGVIGIEFASLFASFGCKVTVIEMLSEILPTVDGEIKSHIRRQLEALGITFMTETELTKVIKKDGQLAACVTSHGKNNTITSEYVMVAVGRKPNTSNIGLDRIGVLTNHNNIMVNHDFETNIPGIYAIGDCNGQIMLAHAASAQGVSAVEHVLGHHTAYYPQTIPSCIYTNPEVAGVGLTEEQAKEKGLKYKVGRFMLSGNGKAIIENNGNGMVKIIAGQKYGEIIGVHIFGPRATDLISEAALAIRLEATEDELISTIHAHPTVSESIAEAALSLNGIAIHQANKK